MFRPVWYKVTERVHTQVREALINHVEPKLMAVVLRRLQNRLRPQIQNQILLHVARTIRERQEKTDGI